MSNTLKTTQSDIISTEFENAAQSSSAESIRFVNELIIAECGEDISEAQFVASYAAEGVAKFIDCLDKTAREDRSESYKLTHQFLGESALMPLIKVSQLVHGRTRERLMDSTAEAALWRVNDLFEQRRQLESDERNADFYGSNVRGVRKLHEIMDRYDGSGILYRTERDEIADRKAEFNALQSNPQTTLGEFASAVGSISKLYIKRGRRDLESGEDMLSEYYGRDMAEVYDELDRNRLPLTITVHI